MMSTVTADSFGIKAKDGIGCVGETATAIKECILDLNSNEKKWNKVQRKQLSFVEKTHNRSHVVEVFDKAIQANLKKIKNIRIEGDTHKMSHGLLRTRIVEATEPCPEGEKYYSIKYPDVKEAVVQGIFESFFFHYHHHGKIEGRKYLCSQYKSYIDNPTEPCPEGEEEYGKQYPGVKFAVAGGQFESMFSHYQSYGKDEGKDYLCLDGNSHSDDPTEPCPEGEEAYAEKYPDVKEAVAAGNFESMLSHYKLFGKDEGKEYSCSSHKSHSDDPTEPCPEGEEAYAEKYPDVKEAVAAGSFESMFSHYIRFGKDEGKEYSCLDKKSYINDPADLCPEGEEAYAKKYPHVKEAVAAGSFESMFSHYDSFGRDEGKEYICFAQKFTNDNPSGLCPEGEEAYGKFYPDVKDAVESGTFENMFSHYQSFGKEEGKKYLCLKKLGATEVHVEKE